MNSDPNPNSNFGPSGAPPENYGTADQEQGKKHQRMLRPLIPAWLDDLGLTKEEFRVYAHLCRRGDREGWSYPAAASIATTCDVSRNTLWRVLNRLEVFGLVERRPVPGRSNHFRVIVPTALSTHPAQTRATTRRKREPPPGANESHHPAQTSSHEGSPLKAVQSAAAKRSSRLDGEPLDGESSKARGDHKPGTVAPACDPSRESNAEARRSPIVWESWKHLPPYIGREWQRLTVEEQDDIWASAIIHSPPPSGWRGARAAWDDLTLAEQEAAWVAAIKAEERPSANPRGGGKESLKKAA